MIYNVEDINICMNRDDICPVSDSLEFFNRKWVLCILMDMFRGKKHFTEFQDSNPDLSNHVLSETLKYIVEVELIKKNKQDILHTSGKNRQIKYCTN